jgi:hypothetical protein
MKNIITKISFLILGLVLIVSCTETKNPVYFDIKNNTSKPIYNGFSYSYPDTRLKGIVNLPTKGTAYKIYPGKVEATPLSLFNYNSTMQVFIVDVDVIETTPWDTIVKYNKILKRYQFTQSELEKMNYEIIYDGN